MTDRRQFPLTGGKADVSCVPCQFPSWAIAARAAPKPNSAVRQSNPAGLGTIANMNSPWHAISSPTVAAPVPVPMPRRS